MQGVVQLILGITAIDTDELSIGEKHLNKCLEIIEPYKNKPEVSLVTLSMFNQNGILWSKREPEKSKMYLEKAELFYKEIKDTKTDVIDYNDLFSTSGEYDKAVAMEKFEKNYTLTLYYLAQIYGVLGDALKSAVYCHVTLKRQLENNDYEAIDWALNTATLSQFFMEKNGFKQARHHLAASSYMLNKYELELNAVNEHNEEYEAKCENFKHRAADVARCWAKYGLLLLSSSRERLLNHTDNIDYNCILPTDLAKLKLEDDSTVSEEDIQNLFFPTLNITELENKITDQFVLTLFDARKVFLNIQQWLAKAATYYTLNNLASDYIEICQDQAQMYESLIFFEENPENQAKLNKRQADILEAVINEVNPTYYLHYCRQIWFKLGQIYTEILDLKSDKLRELKERPTAQALNKINHLADKSIMYFTKFTESFRDLATKEIPKTVIETLQKPFLQAYFHIAALNSRYITLDKNQQLKNLEASLQAYKSVDEYRKNNPKIEEAIATEISIVNEMVTLLPLKIQILKQEIGSGNSVSQN